MQSALSSVHGTISGPTDLDYINEKLLATGFCDVKLHRVAASRGRLVTPTASSPSPQSSQIYSFDHELTVPTPQKSPISTWTNSESLHRTSPDSHIRCCSHDCPIDVEHNLGRYFHEGEQVSDLKDLESQNPYACGMAAVYRFLNFTSPPPDITGAYLRMLGNLSSQNDKDRVRQYQKHHAWSPINSAISSHKRQRSSKKLPVVYAHILPVESSEITKRGRNIDKGIDTMSDIANFNDDPRGQEGPLCLERRVLCVADFEDTDIEDDDPDDRDLGIVDSGIYGSTVESSKTRNLSADDDLDGEDEVWSWWSDPVRGKREVPRGPELSAVQRDLQEKILDQIAIQAFEREHHGI